MGSLIGALRTLPLFIRNIKKVLKIGVIRLRRSIRRVMKRSLLVLIVIGIAGFIIGFWGYNYFPPQFKRVITSISSQFSVFLASSLQGETPTSSLSEETEIVKESPTTQSPEPEKEEGKELPSKYVEEAKPGEGMTHLARRALKRYLEDYPEKFELTPEHKVYIEDYLARKKGYHWIEVNESLEFSKQLIEEAIEKAEQLTPEELDNLSQYTRLVPALNY